MTAYRGTIISFPEPNQYTLTDGYMTVKNGIITRITREKPAGERIIDYSEFLIMPGFVDTHIHLPQLNVRGRWSEDLLTWLERYVFPEEIKYLDEEYSRKNSEKFFDELRKNGTTTALVYGPPTAESTEIALNSARESGLRIYMGQTLMDMNVPDELITTPEKARLTVKQLSEKWRGRTAYALTLRFAVSCSMKLMQKTAQIAKTRNIIIQTHISEQIGEIETVRKIHGMGYAEVYDRAGVLYPKTVLAHAIHLRREELQLIASRGAKIAHCPSSNFFLHSGSMSLSDKEQHKIPVGLGSDIAAGPFINMLPVLRNAYYANMISPEKAFYLLTTGGARVLGLENKIGTLEPGKMADFVVLSAPDGENIRDKLAQLMFLGDDRNIIATYANGKEAWHRNGHHP